MDATVFALASGGLALTVAGAVAAARDVSRRVSDYRDAAARPDPLPPLAASTGAAELGLARRQTPIVAADVDHLRAATARMESRLAAAAGATESLRSLWVKTAVTLLGVALSGVAGVVAAWRA